MTKQDFIEKIAETTGLDKTIIKKVIDEFLENFKSALFEGERVELRSVGVFTVKKMKEKIGRNLKTGEKVLISERYKIKFKPSKIFKKIKLSE